MATADDLDAILDVLHNSGIFSAYLKGFVECLGRIAVNEPARVHQYLLQAWTTSTFKARLSSR